MACNTWWAAQYFARYEEGVRKPIIYKILPGPVWLIGAPGGFPMGLSVFFSHEGWCSHVVSTFGLTALTGLLFIYYFITAHCYYFQWTKPIINSQLIINHSFCANVYFICERSHVRGALRPSGILCRWQFPSPSAFWFSQISLDKCKQLIDHDPIIQEGRKTFILPEGRPFIVS